MKTQPGKRQDYPLSFAQESLWFFDQFAPGSRAYNDVHLFRVPGYMNPTRLEDCINQITRRHDNLRAVFPSKGGVPSQIILPEMKIPLTQVNLSNYGEAGRLGKAIMLAQNEVDKPFDLASGPLMRVTSIKMSGEESLLLFSAHHIIFDAWSRRIFVKELFDVYEVKKEGSTNQVPNLACQYQDYAVRQKEWWAQEEAQSMLAYWKTTLLEGTFILDVPTDFTRPPIQTYGAAEIAKILPSQLYQQVKNTCQRERVSLFMILLASFQVLLQRYSGQAQITIGVPFANRLEREYERLIGLFVHTLPLTCHINPGMTFSELLHQVREMVLDAATNQACPFDRIVEAVKPERDLSRTPIYQVSFNLRNVPSLLATLNQLPIKEINFPQPITAFDLEMEAKEENGALSLLLRYNRDLFTPQTIDTMLTHQVQVLKSATTQPTSPVSGLEILDNNVRDQVLVEWNRTKHDFKLSSNLHAGFEYICANTPNQISIIDGNETITYTELNQRANQLAYTLSKMGIEPETKIGLCLPRSINQIAGLLGILKAGGAYIPMDPEYPRERLEYLIQDTGMSIILTTESLIELLPEIPGVRLFCLDRDWASIQENPGDNLTTTTSLDHLACVLYTSGSTGIPKGIEITHRNIMNYIGFFQQEFQIKHTDRVLQFSTINFDISIEEIFGALLNGATLVLRTPDYLNSIPAFLEKCRSNGITLLSLPTAFWHEITAYLESNDLGIPEDIRIIEIGGERVNPEAVAIGLEHMSPSTRLFNTYGPTETTVAVTFYEILPPADHWRKSREVPIGKPIANTRIYILDDHLNPVPPGVRGEICIAGAGVASGYLNQPAMTAERFIPDPFSSHTGDRMYKSGDIGYFKEDGSIIFIGRKDQQVKLRGFRIEPGEIESVLANHADLKQAKTQLIAGKSGEQYLVAYVVPREKTKVTPSLLYDFLRTKLPKYMIPSAYVIMDSFPLTPSGKIASRLLPYPDTAAFPGRQDATPPSTPLEKTLVILWSKVLGLENIGIEDNFFDLGGHSLLAVQLAAEVKKVTGREFSLQVLFKSPTIASLAKSLQSGFDQAQSSSVVAMRPGNVFPPLFLIPAGARTTMSLNELVTYLDIDHPIYGLEYPGIENQEKLPKSFGGFAEYFIQHIRHIQSEGPYYLGGRCLGGLLAYEIACRLAAAGETIHFLAVIDAAPRKAAGEFSKPTIVQRLADKLFYPYLRFRYYSWVRSILPDRNSRRVLLWLKRVRRLYQPDNYYGPLVLIQSEEHSYLNKGAWQKLAPNLQHYFIPGTSHEDMKNQQVENAYGRIITQAIQNLDENMRKSA